MPTGIHPCTRRAFSLIEVISAMVILSIAVPSMMWGLRDSAKRRIDPIKLTRARWLASEKMEDIFADRHSTARGYPYLISANYPAESTITGFTGFSRSVTISETAANFLTGTGWKTITVNVVYSDSAGTSRTFPLSAVLSKYTP